MTQKTEEERLICEIAKKKQKLTALQLEKASEVQKLYLTDAYGASELRWFLAIVSLVIALCAILGTNKWSTGFPHYFREGAAWFFGLVYFFFVELCHYPFLYSGDLKPWQNLQTSSKTYHY